MKTKRDYAWIYIFLAPSVLIFLAFYIVPIITVFVTSFTKWDGFNLPHFVGMDNYIALFQSTVFQISLKNLLGWSIIAATLHVGFGTLVAFVLFRRKPGWRMVRGVFMIPNVISAAAWAMIYKFVFNNDFGIINSMARVFYPGFQANWFYASPWAFWAITLTWLFYAVYVTLIVLTELLAVPQDLHEAAMLDGATALKTILHIDLPLCRNAIGTGIILSITSRVAMYESIALTSRGGPGDDTQNIPLILVKAINDMKYGYANASAVIMFIIGVLTLLLINWLFRMRESVY